MSTRPLILITNDDGILAPGLARLSAAVQSLGDVLVVAPDREMSATSHAITLHRPLRVQEIPERGMALDGTPVDCTYMGIHHLAPRRPSIVLSGVNLGPNLGTDVLYSGTVAAAREGTIQGIPSVAFSLVSRDTAALEGIEPILAKVTADVLAAGLPSGTTLNVNIPAQRNGHATFQATRLGSRSYTAEVIRRRDPRGHEYLWIGGGFPELEETPGTDTAAVKAGAVSLTPVPMFNVADEQVRQLAARPLCAPTGD